MTHREIPIPSQVSPDVWGSDSIAQCLRSLGLPYLALNPGASYRGLHDSLVNHLGNEHPQMLLCLHEEVAISLAQGYAKVSGTMMGAVVHSNVGLMHATMAIFNAWCDRTPMLILGATGPWDAAKRRPWIDWIHTSADQGALVRDYTKWDNQPGSVPAAIEAILRGKQIAQTSPKGPVYINLDAALQEGKTDHLIASPAPTRYAPPIAPPPGSQELMRAIELIDQTTDVVFLFGRMSSDETHWKQRVALAERAQARVITDLKNPAVFPTHHPQHVAHPGYFMHPLACEAIRQAQVVVLFDWVDAGGAFKQAFGGQAFETKVIHISLDQHNHRGWSMDSGSLLGTDVYMLCEPDQAVKALLEGVKAKTPQSFAPQAPLPNVIADDVVSLRAIADILRPLRKKHSMSFIRLPLGWNGAYLDWQSPTDYWGSEGGGGIGAGPGNTVGAALAMKDTGLGHLPVALLGDGDFLMGNTAVWTAVRYGIPVLFIICNNHSFFNDELHQERVALERGRAVENKWIGQRISEPNIDIAQMARSMGALGIGPITRRQDLQSAIEEGIAAVRAGQVCVIDANVLAGYDANMSGQTANNSNVHKR